MKCTVTVGRDSSVGIATGWSGDRISVGRERFFRTLSDRPWDPPSLMHSGYRLSFRGQSGRSVALTAHPHLGQRLKEE